jgi:tetratricopeptide (TPR) repeat protein
MAVGLFFYWPALHGGWQWDDDLYLTKNPLLHEPGRLWKAWFVPGSFIEYYPIAQTVQWAQWQLWHLDTFGYHVTNVVLHLISALLVWRLLAKLGLHYAWLGGLLFAVHPVHVESVAWIAELKNCLSLPPFLLALGAWIDFEEHDRARDYRAALAWFLAAMLCKISMAPFPIFILVFAWWKRGRVVWADVRHALPFLAIAVLLAGLTIYSGLVYAPGSTPEPSLPFASRLALAGTSVVFYLTAFFWPVHLLPVYAKWPVDPPAPLQFLPLLLLGLLAWFWVRRRGYGRHALLGAAFFLLFLAPFLGLHWVSYMDFTWVMNHFLYIPSIALIALGVATLEAIENALPKTARLLPAVVMALVLVVLGIGTYQYAGLYQDAETLWSYALTLNPNAFAANNNLGLALEARGQPYAAIEHFRRAAEAEPTFAEAHNNIGVVLLDTGYPAQAIPEFRQAVKINPVYPAAHFNLGNALKQAGILPEAIDEYRAALKLSPADPEVHNNLADALLQSGQVPAAYDEYAAALKCDPNYAQALYNWGVALLKSGDVATAIGHFEQAVSLDPNYVEAHFNLGAALYQTGHTPEAIAQFREVLRIKPDFTQAQTILSQLQGGP